MGVLIAWPGVTQTLFMDGAFVGHEGALIRVIGLTLVVIGLGASDMKPKCGIVYDS